MASIDISWNLPPGSRQRSPSDRRLCRRIMPVVSCCSTQDREHGHGRDTRRRHTGKPRRPRSFPAGIRPEIQHLPFDHRRHRRYGDRHAGSAAERGGTPRPGATGYRIRHVPDERREERPLAGPVTVRIGNRSMSTDWVVGPPLGEPLLGQIVIEALDLIADRTNRTLTPRSPTIRCSS